MRTARRFRNELDRWSSWWRGVEVFIERIENARDEDEAPQRVYEALLEVASVAEQQRVAQTGEGLLAPDLQGQGSLAPDERSSRLPGMDTCELAVAQLVNGEEKVTDTVWLPSTLPVYQLEIDGEDQSMAVPSYGYSASQTPQLLDDDIAEAFGPSRRKKAALAGLDPNVPVSDSDDVGDEEPLSWSMLTANRRAESPELPPADELPRLSTEVVEAIQLLLLVAGGSFEPGYDAVTEAESLADQVDQIEQALALALVTVLGDPNDPEDGGALGVLQDEAHDAVEFVEGFVGVYQSILDGYAALATALRQVGQAVASGSDATDAIVAAHGALSTAQSPTGHALLTKAVETTDLGAHLDEAMDTRIAYPDGTLRPVRALELAFRGHWLRQLRIQRRRHHRFLLPRWTAFRLLMTSRLHAFLSGIGVGFEVGGLSLGSEATVASVRLGTNVPAYLSGLDVIEPGQIGVLGGPRPTGAIVLGTTATVEGMLALHIEPLRVSIAAGLDLPGTPGLVAAGTPIETTHGGFDAHSLQTGEHSDGPASDGLVEAALSHWSRLCLVFGRAAVDAELGGRAPADPGQALEPTTWHGALDPSARTLVLHGLPGAHLEAIDGEVVQRVVRAGELLLIHGRDEDGGEVTGVAEVDRAVSFKASQLGQLDGEGIVELSTLAEGLAEPDCELCALCKPDEDLVLVTLRSLDLPTTLVEGITLRRDFGGFEAPSMACGVLLPTDVVAQLQGVATYTPPFDGADRIAEFNAAMRAMASWVRFAAPGTEAP